MSSLGPEITYDYNARTVLFAWRDGFLIAGTLAAAASPALVQAIFQTGEDAAGQRSQFFWISVIYAPPGRGDVRVVRQGHPRTGPCPGSGFSRWLGVTF